MVCEVWCVVCEVWCVRCVVCGVWRVRCDVWLAPHHVCCSLPRLTEAALAEAKKKANMVLPASSVAAGHVITQCNTGRMPDGSAAAAIK